MIWLKRVAMIFSYVMLDIRSISFQKYKNKIKFLGDMQFLSRAIRITSLKSLFYICNLSSHWALSNCCDPLWESLHTPMIKITYTTTHMIYFYTWKIASTAPIHPQIKLHVIPCLSLSKDYHHNVWAIQKEIKRCIPKEGMPHAHKACQKKEKIKDAYPKKVCHMPPRHDN